MGERTLFLVRHGQLDMEAYAANPRAAGLTAKGRKQAQLTAKRLRSLDVDVIHCSTIQRARETAEIVSKSFPAVSVRRSGLLREIPGPGIHFPEVESRANEAFTKYCRPCRGRARIELVICHGNLIRYLAYKVMGFDSESWVSLGTSHCGITQVRINPDGHMRLVCYNDTGHLPERFQS